MDVLPEERLLAHILCSERSCWRCRLWPRRRHGPWWRDDPIAQRFQFHHEGDCPRCGRRAALLAETEGEGR